MEKNTKNDTMLQEILSILSHNGFCFNNVSIEKCENLSNADGFSFSSFELHKGFFYRVYCINGQDQNTVYRKIADNKDSFKEFIEDFTCISYCSENDLNPLQIYLHQVGQNLPLKSILLNNYDDNYQLQSIYASFISFFNVISKHQISIVLPNPETIVLNTERKIIIDNLDYFRSTEIKRGPETKVDYSLYLNSIWLLTFLRVVIDKPDLLVSDKIFLDLEKGRLEDFLTEQVVPYLKNKEYRLLFSLITCIQQNKAVDIEIDSSNSINTEFTFDEWQNARLVSNGWYSPDGSRFYGIRVQECTPRYSFHRFRSVPSSIKLEGERLSIICNRAFRECNYLEDVSIPEGVTTIGEDAFFGLKHIERINFPESLKAICANPFKGVIIDELNNLSSCFIATSNALYSKGLHRLISFYGDTEEFLVPNQTKIIGEHAFAYSKSIVEISIGKSVNEIRDKAFYLCPKLKKVSLPIGLIRIGEKAFFQLNIKHDYDLDDNKETFEPALEELRIPSSVVFIGRAAFNGIRKIENDSPYFKIDHDALLTNDGTNLIYYFGKAKKYRIPSGVESVWNAAFMGNERIEEITVPRSVSVIESNAFQGCQQLRSVVFNCDYLFLGDSAFSDCKKLSSVKMPKRMGNLSENTFRNCQALSEVEIPEGVEIIGHASFWYCYSLKDVVLPSSIKTIENNAFQSCHGLRDIHLPEGLKMIGNNAFDGCESLSTIILPDSLEFIGYFAFSSCPLKECIVSNEKTMFDHDVFGSNNDMMLIIPPKADPHKYSKIIPKGVCDYTETSYGPLPNLGPLTENIVPYIEDKTIDELLSPADFHYSYYGKPTYIDNNGGVYVDGMQRLIDIEKEKIKNKKKYIVSSRTKYICNYVFGEKYSYLRAPAPFEIIVLPKNLVAIGDYCFANSRIKEINLPDSLEYIGDFAFMDCADLSSVVIPRNVKYIGINPFYISWKFQVSHLNEIISESLNFVVESNCLLSADKTNLITCYQKKMTHETSDGRKSQSMVDFIIPEGVKRICKYSFARVEVKSVTIPSSVDIIDEGAFENGLFSSISIPAQIKYIGEKAFSQCNALQNADISKTSVTIIEKELFDGCNALESIALPDCSISIGDYVFQGCKKLLSICLPKSIETIGANPFVESGISEIIINNDNFRFTDGILYGCEGKEIIAVLSTANKSVMIPEGVEIIRQEAFAKNAIIEEVTCPTSLRVISLKAFAGCTSLRRINLEDSSVEKLAESVFDGCNQLEFVSLPKHLCQIEDYAFQRCEKLETLSIPRSVRIIKGKAFERSGLKRIYLSYGLKEEMLPWEFRRKAKHLSLEECNLIKDESGVVFSRDKKVLIEAPYGLESYNIPIGTEEISSGAFINARKLKLISFPNTIKILGGGFNSLFDEFVLPDSVTEIGNGLFLCAQKIRELIIPSSVKTIHGNPFGMMFNSKTGNPCKIINHSESFSLINGILYSKDLKILICCTDYAKKVVDILDSVEHINDNAFYGCCSKYIEIPDSVRHIGERSFFGISVPEIVIPETIETIGEQAFCHIDVPELHIPGSIKTISDKSFGYCTAVKIELSEGIKEIKHAAFTFCGNLEEISIPQSVDLIERAAFWGCHNLETIRFFNPQIIIENDVFEYCKKIKKVVVPKGSINRFRRDFPAFANRFEEAIENEA